MHNGLLIAMYTAHAYKYLQHKNEQLKRHSRGVGSSGKRKRGDREIK